mgnify:CR=1 FL=1
MSLLCRSRGCEHRRGGAQASHSAGSTPSRHVDIDFQLTLSSPPHQSTCVSCLHGGGGEGGGDGGGGEGGGGEGGGEGGGGVLCLHAISNSSYEAPVSGNARSPIARSRYGTFSVSTSALSSYLVEVIGGVGRAALAPTRATASRD